MSAQEGIPYTETDRKGDDVNLIDLAIVLARYKKNILAFSLLCMLVASVVTFFIPDSYKASSKLNLTGGSVSTPLVVSILQSSTMRDSLVNDLKLKAHYNVPTDWQAGQRLNNLAEIELDKNGLLVINVTDREPKFAAMIAQAYQKRLFTFVYRYALTESSRRRVYLERRLPEMKKKYEQAQSNLSAVEPPPDNASFDAHILAVLKKSAELKAKISMKELELFSMQSLNMTTSPNYLLVQEELNALWLEFGRDVQNNFVSGKAITKESEYLRRIQEFEYAETRYEQLLKQIDKARLDQSFDTPIIQEVVSAKVPREKSAPDRFRIIAGCTFTGLVMASFWSLIYDAFHRAVETDSKNQLRIEVLKKTLVWK